MEPMCLVLLTYVRPIEEVNAHRAAHVRWIEDAIEEGVIVLAGRKAGADGGVLLLRGLPELVEPFARTDPYVMSGVATIEVVAFTASLAMRGIGDLF